MTGGVTFNITAGEQYCHQSIREGKIKRKRQLLSIILVCTYREERMLQLQSEGGERHLLRDGQDCHRGKVGGLVARVPFAARGVQCQTATW